MSLIIGLTGGIGAGKSTASAHLRASGLPVVDADAISRALTGPGAAGSLAVAEAFGPEFLTPEGAMDRRRMRELAFRDAGALKRLEACLHPLIGAAVTREFESLSASPIVIYDCPLLWRDDFAHLPSAAFWSSTPRTTFVSHASSPVPDSRRRPPA